MRGIGFWQCAAEGGKRDGLVQDPSLKCLKSIHTELRGREREGRWARAGSSVNGCGSE